MCTAFAPGGVDVRVDLRGGDAHRDAETGKVQEVIKRCRNTGFDKFALRAKQQEKRALLGFQWLQSVYLCICFYAKDV